MNALKEIRNNNQSIEGMFGFTGVSLISSPVFSGGGRNLKQHNTATQSFK